VERNPEPIRWLGAQPATLAAPGPDQHLEGVKRVGGWSTHIISQLSIIREYKCYEARVEGEIWFPFLQVRKRGLKS
jgi:hypothetical protein